MRVGPASDDKHPMNVYSPREIALASGAPETEVRAALATAAGGVVPAYVSHADAVRIGRLMAKGTRLPLAHIAPAQSGSPLYAVRLAVSGTVHAGLIAFVAF